MLVSLIFVLLAVASAVVVANDLRRNPQSMHIMNAVWILTALWAGVLGLLVYCHFGREKRFKPKMVDVADMGGMDMSKMDMSGMGEEHKMGTMEMPQKSGVRSLLLSTLHCGAGCTLADILSPLALFIFPVMLCGSHVYGSWAFSYVLALIIGVWFQYSAIRAMDDELTVGRAVTRALKADFFSLTAWQAGMCLWLYLLIFKWEVLPQTGALSWDFWFAMQQAMAVGFIFALPVNYLLIKLKIKSSM